MSNFENATVNTLLTELTGELAHYLNHVLPPLGANWWTSAVLDNLSFQQRRRIEEGHLTTLEDLDLLALLRVFDQNWHLLSDRLALGADYRHYLKEMQSVRNRWSHRSTSGFNDDDVYRDLDTIKRFASMISASEDLVRAVQDSKRRVINAVIGSSPLNYQPTIGAEITSSRRAFEVGQVVQLKSSSLKKGAITKIYVSEPENRYDVFIDGARQSLYESQLQEESVPDGSIEQVTIGKLRAMLSALQLRNPSLSQLYSLNAARINFIPYQFRPVLRFVRADRPRLLIADGVGVGKTIEAGLILKELQARRDLRSVLIICPKPLITENKWLIEMKRFDERFLHLDGPKLRYCINEMDLEGAWPEEFRRAIVPYSLFDETVLFGTQGPRTQKGLLSLDPAPRFDLVIVDEAHHIRNTETYSHRAVRFFCDYAEAVIFLTATPIQLRNDDLFVLLNTLRPDVVRDRITFEHMAQPNPHINRAITLTRAMGTDWASEAMGELEDAAATEWGEAVIRANPTFQQSCDTLRQEAITLEKRVDLIAKMESLHSFAPMISRTRRKDIGDFCVRRPETVAVEFTPSQRRLHDAIVIAQSEILSRLHSRPNVAFMMTTLRRQVASCIHGLLPLIDDILSRRLSELVELELDDTMGQRMSDVPEQIRELLSGIRQLAEELDDFDPKLTELKRILEHKTAQANRRVMLFSSFRHTLRYLFNHLSEAGYRVGLVHGDTPDVERVLARERFQKEATDQDAIDVLLFSEIGCEGLDYQFCDCMVNYDLPWNPMRVEQRIGRIDRNGQQSEYVTIVNMITPGTVDADIYERCLVRIGIFNNALGASEEILGQLTRAIHIIAEDQGLTEEERRAKLQQLADNEVRLIREEEELELRQIELFGIQLTTRQFERDVEEASNYWLTAPSLQHLVNQYLNLTLPAEQDYILGEKPLKTLRLSQEARQALLNHFDQPGRRASTIDREWENWLKGGAPYLSLTFEASCAAQTPDAAFITPLHPLVRQAAKYLSIHGRVAVSLKVVTDTVNPGLYPFSVHLWRIYGVREDQRLCPVALDRTVSEQLLRLLQVAEDNLTNRSNVLSQQVATDLEKAHYHRWATAKEAHVETVNRVIGYRRESLLVSHKARIALLEEQRDQATDERIQRMRDSQIAAANEDYSRRLQDIEIAGERADIVADLIVSGVIEVQKRS